jgi:hypothetical protein
MLSRALDAGIPAAWVTGDEVYGADPSLRAELEARRIGYVLAVACDHLVRVGGGRRRVDALAASVPVRRAASQLTAAVSCAAGGHVGRSTAQRPGRAAR